MLSSAPYTRVLNPMVDCYEVSENLTTHSHYAMELCTDSLEI